MNIEYCDTCHLKLGAIRHCDECIRARNESLRAYKGTKNMREEIQRLHKQIAELTKALYALRAGTDD